MIARRELLVGGAFLGASRLAKGLQLRRQPKPALAAIEEDSGFVKSYAFQNLSSWITPGDQFFVRNHFPPPSLDLKTWKLTVEGEVERRLALGYEELRSLPAASQVVTLECTGNPPGGGMVSTGKWTGPALRDLLQRAGVQPQAREVILEGADRGPVEDLSQPVAFARAIPLAKAMHPSTLLAHTLNDQPLPPALGFPLRAVISGWYAANSVKWLTRIIVVRDPFEGFFQAQRYIFIRHTTRGREAIPARELRVKSQIARPVPNTLLSRRPYTIRGAAWSGEVPIKTVEVSLDQGKSWQAASLGRDSAPYAWRLWEFPWPEPQPGAYSIGCRASDRAGRLQPLDPDAEELTAYGKNAVAWVNVSVR